MKKICLYGGLLSLVAFSSTAFSAPLVCEGELPCLSKAVKSHLVAELQKKGSPLRKHYEAVNNESDHYECYAEIENPYGEPHTDAVTETLREPDVRLLEAGASDERERDSDHASYENSFVASVALPADCNEGGVIHNWYPRLTLLVKAEEEVLEREGGNRRLSLKLSIHALGSRKRIR